MALIKCKECGKEISDTATKCIHCGLPLTNITTNHYHNISSKNSSEKVLNIIIVICLSLFTIYALYSLYNNCTIIFSSEKSVYSNSVEKLYNIFYTITTIIYIPVSALILWLIYFDSHSKTNIFKIISGVILIIDIIIWLVSIIFFGMTYKNNFLMGAINDFTIKYGILIIFYLMSIRRK